MITCPVGPLERGAGWAGDREGISSPHCLADWMSRRMHGAAQVFLLSEAGGLNPKRTSHIEGSELK